MPLFGAPGERIAYQVYDHPDDAPPILLIHGFTASSASFLANIQDLRRNFTVVTVDLLGHGQSEAPAELDPYQPEAAIARIVGGHEASIGLHRSVGFAEVGIEREVGRKFGTWLDVVVMQRML